MDREFILREDMLFEMQDIRYDLRLGPRQGDPKISTWLDADDSGTYVPTNTSVLNYNLPEQDHSQR